MVTAVTKNIKVSVETFYQEAHSTLDKHVFAYRITIRNESSTVIQLLRRYWEIVDGIGFKREVEGEGVVGLQPILKPGQSHCYVSGCHLATDLGKMEGAYLMRNIDSKKTFSVKVPTFAMVAPYKLN